MSNRIKQDDLVAAGFKRLDPKLISDNPPTIRFGEIYKDWGLRQRLRYCERLAATMNDAAARIQAERDKMNDMLLMKEKQVQSASASIKRSDDMVQGQITKHNTEKQELHKVIADLNAQIRELKR